MNRRILFLVLILVCAVKADAQRMAEIMRNVYVQPERICQLLLEGQGDSIIARGNAQFKAVAKPEMFSGIVPMLEKQLGKFRGVENWTSAEGVQNLRVYVRKFVFERYTIPLVVSSDNDGKMAGLVFGAPQVIDRNPVAANEREIVIETDGLKMPGRITLPADGRKKHPCVILVHGSGPNNMNEACGGHKPFLDLAEGLSRRGIAVVRYDKRTFTHKGNSVPAGKEGNYDTETVDDAVSAVELVRRMDDVCADSIYIIGHSLGAMLAPRIAGKAAGVAGFVAMAAPARKMRELMEEQVAYITKASRDSVVSQVDALMASLPESYLEMDSVYSAAAAASDLKIPMLFMQGGKGLSSDNG